MSTEEGIRLGLQAAAAHLEDTAADYEQMAATKERFKQAGRIIGNDGAEIRALREKAQLLRGQAGAIRELRVSRRR